MNTVLKELCACSNERDFLCVLLFLSVISDQHFHIVCGIFCAEYNINILNLASAKNLTDVEKQLHYNTDALSKSFAILRTCSFPVTSDQILAYLCRLHTALIWSI